MIHIYTLKWDLKFISDKETMLVEPSSSYNFHFICRPGLYDTLFEGYKYITYKSQYSDFTIGKEKKYTGSRVSDSQP